MDTWIIENMIEVMIKLSKNMPFKIHGDINPKPLFGYPTHTHGLEKIGLPEIFINNVAFGATVNAIMINIIAAALIINKNLQKKFMEETIITMKTGFFDPKEDITFSLRKVEPTFNAVKKAYNDNYIPKHGYAQLWVDGDDHVLDDDYYEIVDVGSKCNCNCSLYKHNKFNGDI